MLVEFSVVLIGVMAVLITATAIGVSAWNSWRAGHVAEWLAETIVADRYFGPATQGRLMEEAFAAGLSLDEQSPLEVVITQDGAACSGPLPTIEPTPTPSFDPSASPSATPSPTPTLYTPEPSSWAAGQQAAGCYLSWGDEAWLPDGSFIWVSFQAEGGAFFGVELWPASASATEFGGY